MKTRSNADKQAERAIMEEIRKSMNDANSLIEDKDLSFTELQRIAFRIAEIRQLLGVWAALETRLDPARAAAEEIRVLKERFLELEGEVKEVRNGLEREQRRGRDVCCGNDTKH